MTEGKARPTANDHPVVIADITGCARAMIEAAAEADRWDLSSFVAHNNAAGGDRQAAAKAQAFRNALAMLRNVARGDT